MNMLMKHTSQDWRGTPGEETKALNLVLQGSGAHGAFGWGILDKLLEDGRIDVQGIAATGSGAMNAAVYAYGNMTGGKEKARTSLEQFWRKASEGVSWGNTLRRSPLSQMFAMAEPISRHWFERLTQLLSPYDLNPLNLDPMRTILDTMVDFGELRRCKSTQLAINATNVRTGRPRTFTTPQMSADAVLASACQPTISQAVEIEGEFYWDGVYGGPPNLAPLIAGAQIHDVLIGQINPIQRRAIPRQAYEFQDRVNEILLHNALACECAHANMALPLRIYTVRSDEVISDQSVSSKFDTSWRFLTRLRDAGRLAAELWLETDFDRLGQYSSPDTFRQFEEIMP